MKWCLSFNPQYLHKGRTGLLRMELYLPIFASSFKMNWMCFIISLISVLTQSSLTLYNHPRKWLTNAWIQGQCGQTYLFYKHVQLNKYGYCIQVTYALQMRLSSFSVSFDHAFLSLRVHEFIRMFPFFLLYCELQESSSSVGFTHPFILSVCAFCEPSITGKC